MSLKCRLSQKPSITWHRGSYFQRFQLTYQELWESASAKTTFILRSRSSQLYGDPIRGQVCVHYRCSSINAQDSNLVWSFSVYVHCTSFSIHLGNFIKMKKSYNRYLAFDPLFALVWCRRLSNDTKHCASWLYCEITNWKDWAKKDFVSNKKGRMGLKEYILCFMLIQKNKYVLMWNYILPIYGICKGKCKTPSLSVEPSQHTSLRYHRFFFYLCILLSRQNLVPTLPTMQPLGWRF